MPASVTHAFFANDVYDILTEKIRNTLILDKCKMYSQSIDACKFYNLLSLVPGKKIRDFDKYFHNNKSQDFFINFLTYMKDNDINDSDTYSFLFGFISHYVLDSTIHPYVIYKTGEFDKNNKDSFKYNNLHHFMESFIDNDMISRRYNTNPYKFDYSGFIFTDKDISKELDKTIDYAFYNTFGINNMSKIYTKSLKQMDVFIRLFRKDSYGIKKFFYKLIDTFTFKNTFRLDAISYHVPLEDEHNYLNKDNLLWRNPTTYNMTSNESFVDLYLKAVKKAKVIVCACYDYLNGKDIDLKQIFDNTSYVTGINCDDKKELKYFEF